MHARRNQRFDRPADDLRARVPEQALSLTIDGDDLTIRVHHQGCIGHPFEYSRVDIRPAHLRTRAGRGFREALKWRLKGLTHVPYGRRPSLVSGAGLRGHTDTVRQDPWRDDFEARLSAGRPYRSWFVLMTQGMTDKVLHDDQIQPSAPSLKSARRTG